MSSDLELRTRLTADASGLTDAMRQAGRTTQEYVRGVEGAGSAAKTTGTAEREAAAATNSSTSARKAFLDTLAEQVRLYGKSTEEVLRYRAAQAGVSEAAAPLILQLQNQRAAQTAAADAAREEAAAQREAAAAKKTAEAAQAAFLNSLREQVELQGKSGGDVMRYRAQQLGVGPEAEQLIARYEASLGKAGVTAGQTAAAMRMLPAQITDITTSLASGMPVWMVAIQQGGQMKDSFGGIGPMFSALSAAITPTVVAIGAATAVVGGLALAYMQAHAETDAFNRSIIMSGNFAGTTADQMAGMARNVSAVVGTQAQAATTLAMLVATGDVAARNLERFSVTATKMERDVSISIQDTVKNFEELGRAPLEKSLQLNQAYGYLTTSTYARIKALTEQKRMEEAGELAQKAFADAMDTRTRRIEENLGTLQRAARATGDFFKAMWDAVLNIGRPETLQDQLAAVEKQIKELTERRGKAAANDDAMAKAMFGDAAPVNGKASTDAALQALQVRRTLLAQQIAIAASQARMDAEQRSAVNKSIEDDKQADQERSALAAAQISRIKDTLSGLTGAYSDADRIIEQQHQENLLDERTYWDAKRALIAANAQAQITALEQENAVLNRQKVYGAERIQRDQQVASNVAEIARTRAKAAADTVIATGQEEAGYRRLTLAIAEYGKQLGETEQARFREQQRDLANVGRGDAARALAARLTGVDERYLQQRSQLETQRATRQITETEYRQKLDALEAYHKRALEDEVGFQEQLQVAQEDGTLGMQRALENYADKARNVAGQTEELFSNAFQSMEDAVVKFAMTGKLNFTSFAESVIADLVRIYVRQQLVGIFAQVASYFGSGMTVDTGGYGMTPADGSVPLPTAGGRAGGGRVDAGSMYRVIEDGPELLSVDGRDYLMMGRRSGAVTPTDRTLMPLPAPQLGTAAAAGAAAPGVNISMPLTLVNNSGTPLRATPQQRGDGGMDVIIEALESAMASNVSSGVGPMASAIEGRYALRPSMAI